MQGVCVSLTKGINQQLEGLEMVCIGATVENHLKAGEECLMSAQLPVSLNSVEGDRPIRCLLLFTLQRVL